MSDDDHLLYFDMDGNPISMWQWSHLLDDPNSISRHIADDYLGTGDGVIRVSTVYVGLNMNYWGGPPLIFETMIFGFSDEELDQMQWRWPTKAAALAGHDQVMAMVREALSKR